jgi:hypothetical protein
MVYASLDVAGKGALLAWVGRHAGAKAWVYLGLSTAFSMGFLYHPLLAFWICQHVCEHPPSRDGDASSEAEYAHLWRHVLDTGAPAYQFTAQPTLSYYG